METQIPSNLCNSDYKKMLKKIKSYDDALFLDWDHDRMLWAVKRKDYQGGVHHIFFVQESDGLFRQLDERILHQLYECDIWRHFKDGSDFYKFFHEYNKSVELKHNTIRQEYLKWYNKDHRTEWKQALENAQRGILHIPEEEEIKIYSTSSTPSNPIKEKKNASL